MHWKLNAATLAASCLFFGSAAAFAQTPPTPTKPQDPAPASREKRDTNDEVVGSVRRGTKLLNCKVKNTKGEEIGKVEDLVMDREAGTVGYAILSFGGVLGVGEKLFAIPFAKVVRTDDATCVVADLTKAQLENAPKFASDTWPTFDRNYGKSVHDFYKAAPYWDVPTTASLDPTHISKDALDKDRLHARGMCRMSKAIGTDVEDTGGKNLGDIDDFVIDDRTGRVVYAVLSFGGILGMGEKLFAIPFASLTRSEKDDDKVVLDVAKDRLKAAPGFDKKNWPNMADRQWGADIHKYYGQDPFWNSSKDKRDPNSGTH